MDVWEVEVAVEVEVDAEVDAEVEVDVEVDEEGGIPRTSWNQRYLN